MFFFTWPALYQCNDPEHNNVNNATINVHMLLQNDYSSIYSKYFILLLAAPFRFHIARFFHKTFCFHVCIVVYKYTNIHRLRESSASIWTCNFSLLCLYLNTFVHGFPQSYENNQSNHAIYTMNCLCSQKTI